MKRALQQVAAVLVLTVAAQAQSQVVASTFGPGDTFVPNTGWTVSGTSLGLATVAAPFTASASGSLAAVRVAIFGVTTPDALVVGLYLGSDINDASLLEQFSTTVGDDAAIVSLASMLHPTLTAGQSYFLAMSTGADSWYAWNHSTSGSVGAFYQIGEEGAWAANSLDASPAFDVTVSPLATPEPATVWLLGGGLLLVGGLLRRRADRRA